MSIPVGPQPQWWYQSTPLPSGAWTYTYTTGTVGTPAAKESHASIHDVPGWERTPRNAEGLLEKDGRVGWTALTTGSDKTIVMDAEGKLYVWKHTQLKPHRTAHAHWGVQLSSYQLTKNGAVQIAAYIPKEASADMKILGVHSWLNPEAEYLKIGKVLGKPVDQ